MHTPPRAAMLVLLLLVLSGSPSRAGEVPSTGTERRLVELKRQVMSADYRADLAELARLRTALAPLRDDAEWGYLARYWAGFASWRIALNGVNKGLKPPELMEHLQRAVNDFEQSLQRRPDFADSAAASSSVSGWLGVFHRSAGDAGVAAAQEDLARARARLAEAKRLAPGNPRVLWVEGGTLFFIPPAYGGDPAKGMATWRASLAASDGEHLENTALPSWGKPESLMALSFGHLNQPVPDLPLARSEADAALRLQPEWSYVRDILLPAIEAKRSAPDAGKP